MNPTTGNGFGVGLRNRGTCSMSLKGPQVSSLKGLLLEFFLVVSVNG